MNLFASAGIDLPPTGGGKRPARPRQARVPLFNHRVVDDARKRMVFAPSEAEQKIAKDYAKLARSSSFLSKKETAVRPIFIDQILIQLLGFTRIDNEATYTLADEHSIRAGSVDLALGTFQADGTSDRVLAPFELKGPGTDLDAIMPGRAKSPVQQAWEYAIDVPGSKWVLVSNCVEIRLYGFGRGREAYELFDLTRLDEEDEFARLYQILSATRFLGGETEALLRETDIAYTTITNELYLKYKELRGQLIAFLRDEVDGPKMPWLQSIEAAQKILDRILFIAFAERTDLLPERMLERAKNARNEFLPAPIWDNFRRLFHFVDIGHRQDGLVIPAYNGGLFAVDPALDGVSIPDPLATDLAGLGEWDYRREVPVTVLGHIFEQSITDIEELKADASGEEAPKIGKRKRDGVVYTPDMITRFLVEQTLGRTLQERFDALKAEHGITNTSSEEDEKPFWQAYLAFLRGVTILDPACGSGAFLVAVFDRLAEEYRRVTARLAALQVVPEFDWLDEIVTKNLYGVDINPESVEITRLALWLKTARRDHRLQNLEHTIRCGDSLVSDKTFTPRPFDWHEAFGEVFARGGFDIVIGNPPYVRMELIKAMKPYLEAHYVVAHGQADLYAYFFERGVKVLRPEGRLGFISSSTFFRTGSGENLRTFLGDGLSMESIVDFGDLQVFEGVTTYPAILTLKKAEAPEGELDYLALTDQVPDDLGQLFKETKKSMPRARLTAGAWRLEGDALSALRDKITKGRKTLGEVYGPPLYGIKTGLNEAFIIDRATRDRLIKADPKSADLLKPFLRGENVKRWRVESEDLWVVNVYFGLTQTLFEKSADQTKTDLPSEKTAWKQFSKAYPAIASHLALHEKAARIRTDQGHYWWELRACTYMDAFEKPKISFGHFAVERIFTFDDAGYFSNDKSYIIPSTDLPLLSLLNSQVLWFIIKGLAPAVRGGFYELRVQYIEQLPIPDLSPADRATLETLAETCTQSAQARYAIQSQTRRRILDLATGTKRKLTGKLNAFHTLDFADFLGEVKKAFRVDIPLKQRGEWQDFIAEASTQINTLTTTIEATEREIDATVYRLFDLTADEIALIEAAVKG